MVEILPYFYPCLTWMVGKGCRYQGSSSLFSLKMVDRINFK